MPKYEYGFGPDRDYYGPQSSQTVYDVGGLGIIVIIANTLFAAIIITALTRNQFSAGTAIIAGGVYYALTTLAALLILSGALSQMVTNRQEQTTLRHYHTLYYSVERADSPRLPAADPLQLPGAPPAPTAPPLGGNTYVPAEEMTTRRNAALWAISLYGPDGLPDGGQVHLDTRKERPGRLRVGAPAAKERAWLTHMKVLEDIPHGVRLRIERYPDAATLRDILNG